MPHARVPVLVELLLPPPSPLFDCVRQERQGLCPLVPESRNSHPRVAVACAPLARVRVSIQLFPPPPILAGRQSRMPHDECGFQPEGRVGIMDRLCLLQYRHCASGRMPRRLSACRWRNDNGLPIECVRKRLAAHLWARVRISGRWLRHICEERVTCAACQTSTALRLRALNAQR